MPVSAIRERGTFKVNSEGTGLEAIHPPKVRSAELAMKWRKESAGKGK